MFSVRRTREPRRLLSVSLRRCAPRHMGRLRTRGGSGDGCSRRARTASHFAVHCCGAVRSRRGLRTRGASGDACSRRARTASPSPAIAALRSPRVRWASHSAGLRRRLSAESATRVAFAFHGGAARRGGGFAPAGLGSDGCSRRARTASPSLHCGAARFAAGASPCGHSGDACSRRARTASPSRFIAAAARRRRRLPATAGTQSDACSRRAQTASPSQRHCGAARCGRELPAPAGLRRCMFAESANRVRVSAARRALLFAVRHVAVKAIVVVSRPSW